MTNSTEKKVRETTTFNNSLKNMKYIGVTLNKQVKDLHNLYNKITTCILKTLRH